MTHFKRREGFGGEQRGLSSAVSSLLFSRGVDKHQVTKSGSYIYENAASEYHEWEFRTMLKMRGISKDDNERYAEGMSKVLEGLRGESFVVAKEIGIDRLCHPGDEYQDAGVDVLVAAIKLSVFPQTTFEAKELFRQYTKTSGPLSRQNGESMHGFISRRRRCWKLLSELDKED